MGHRPRDTECLGLHSHGEKVPGGSAAMLEKTSASLLRVRGGCWSESFPVGQAKGSNTEGLQEIPDQMWLDMDTTRSSTPHGESVLRWAPPWVRIRTRLSLSRVSRPRDGHRSGQVSTNRSTGELKGALLSQGWTWGPTQISIFLSCLMWP